MVAPCCGSAVVLLKLIRSLRFLMSLLLFFFLFGHGTNSDLQSLVLVMGHILSWILHLNG